MEEILSREQARGKDREKEIEVARSVRAPLPCVVV